MTTKIILFSQNFYWVMKRDEERKKRKMKWKLIQIIKTVLSFLSYFYNKIFEIFASFLHIEKNFKKLFNKLKLWKKIWRSWTNWIRSWIKNWKKNLEKEEERELNNKYNSRIQRSVKIVRIWRFTWKHLINKLKIQNCEKLSRTTTIKLKKYWNIQQLKLFEHLNKFHSH